MTAKDWKKQLLILNHKPGKVAKYIKNNGKADRSCGVDKHHCVRCGRTGGHIQKYGLHLCRQCFRDNATKLGFKKYC